jgi:hypothetical protein
MLYRRRSRKPKKMLTPRIAVSEAERRCDPKLSQGVAPVNFYTVVESARRRGEVAIGYRITKDAHNADEQYGIVINPAKSETITFAEDDRVIVVAED